VTRDIVDGTEMAEGDAYTVTPLQAADGSTTIVPEFIRLPKPGSRELFHRIVPVQVA
jgi:hypothetical protein